MNEWIILSQSDWDKYFLIQVMFLISKEADMQYSKSGGKNSVAYLNLVNFLRDWITGGDVDSFGFVRIAAEAIRGAPARHILCAELNWR